MVCGVDKDIHLGKEAAISILMYRSHKNSRAASSSLLNESCAFSETVADAEWVASWLGLAKDLHYDLRKRDKLNNREIKITSILSEKDCELDIASITDAKSLYDTLSQEQYTGAEKRAALEVCVIRDSLEALGGKARWVPHDKNPVDCFIKLGGNVQPLVDFMRRSTYKFIEEESEMEQRKEYRELTGRRDPRPNVSISGKEEKFSYLYRNSELMPFLFYTCDQLKAKDSSYTKPSATQGSYFFKMSGGPRSNPSILLSTSMR